MNSEANQQEQAQESEDLLVKSRFGEITVDMSKSLHFPQGLLGLPDNLHFCVTDMPLQNFGQFRLLQCLNDHSVSFVVLPVDVDNPFIEKQDIEGCAKTLGVSDEDFLCLLIATPLRSPTETKITLNLRAPIVIDANAKAAIQYVFPDAKYEIAHNISG